MRKLEYYLATCEASFRVGGACVFQVQLARRHDRAPITRDYIAEYEALLRKRDGVEMVEAPLQQNVPRATPPLREFERQRREAGSPFIVAVAE